MWFRSIKHGPVASRGLDPPNRASRPLSTKVIRYHLKTDGQSSQGRVAMLSGKSR